MKRFFDFICSLLAIILLSPVLLLLSMVILIDSGRPIVFRQKRVAFPPYSLLLSSFDGAP